MRWIISARDDMVWFIGSVLSSYLLLALYLSGVVGLLPMVATWAILIDAPHVFGTFSRTYFDRSEWKARKRLLLASLLFFAVGPLMVLTGFGLEFFFIAALWAYYHLVKQHYGFMVLYKKKNQDLAQADSILDRAFLLLAFTYPFVAFIEMDASAMSRVPAPLRSAVGILASVLLIATILSGTAWVGRQIQRAIKGQSLDLPKYLLLAAAIPMHWVVLLTPMPDKPIAIVAILTIYHNLQYQRLIWFHNKKYTRGAAPSTIANENMDQSIISSPQTALRNTYGPAALISRRLLYYIAFGILFGLIYQGPRQYLGYVVLRDHSSASGSGEQSLAVQLGIAFLWGYAFIHYYLDSKIWRVRRDPEVGRALQMN